LEEKAAQVLLSELSTKPVEQVVQVSPAAVGQVAQLAT